MPNKIKYKNRIGGFFILSPQFNNVFYIYTDYEFDKSANFSRLYKCSVVYLYPCYLILFGDNRSLHFLCADFGWRTFHLQGEIMAEDKQQTLTKLYSLRAGISAVASQRNKVEDINKQADDKITNLEFKNRSAEREIESLKTDIKNTEDMLSYEEYEKQNKTNILPPRKPSRFLELLPVLLTIIVLGCAVAYIYAYFTVIRVEGWFNIILAILFIACGFVCIGCLFVLGAYIFEIFEDLPYYTYSFYDEYKKELENYNKIKNIEIPAHSNKIIELQERKNELIQKISNNNKLITENRTKITQLKIAAEKDCVPHYQIGGLIQEQFENQFNSFLNLRDWKNIDIIIFAYESGRVDSMREALTYADGETRADRIVNAINASTQSVCRSIQSGLHSLALSMGGGVFKRYLAADRRANEKA